MQAIKDTSIIKRETDINIKSFYFIPTLNPELWTCRSIFLKSKLWATRGRSRITKSDASRRCQPTVHQWARANVFLHLVFWWEKYWAAPLHSLTTGKHSSRPTFWSKDQLNRPNGCKVINQNVSVTIENFKWAGFARRHRGSSYYSQGNYIECIEKTQK